MFVPPDSLSTTVHSAEGGGPVTVTLSFISVSSLAIWVRQAVASGETREGEEPVVRVFIPWFPSYDVALPWIFQGDPLWNFLSFSVLSFPLSFWVLVVGKASPLLLHYPLWYPYILPTIVSLYIKPPHIIPIWVPSISCQMLIDTVVSRISSRKIIRYFHRFWAPLSSS